MDRKKKCISQSLGVCIVSPGIDFLVLIHYYLMNYKKLLQLVLYTTIRHNSRVVSDPNHRLLFSSWQNTKVLIFFAHPHYFLFSLRSPHCSH
jgi:hypothetical protein